MFLVFKLTADVILLEKNVDLSNDDFPNVFRLRPFVLCLFVYYDSLPTMSVHLMPVCLMDGSLCLFLFIILNQIYLLAKVNVFYAFFLTKIAVKCFYVLFVKLIYLQCVFLCSYGHHVLHKPPIQVCFYLNNREEK